MAVLLSLIALLALVAAGAGLASLLAPPGWTWLVPEALAVILVYGAAGVSLAVFGLGLVLGGAALQAAVMAGAAVLLGVGVVAGRGRILRRERHRPSLLEVAAWLVILAQFAFATWIAVYRSDLGWDGLVNWEIKAHLACLNNGSPPLVYFQDDTWLRTHPGYPWLVPAIETWLYLWAGQCSQSLAKIILLLFCVAAVGLLYAGGARLAGSRLTGLLAAILLFCIPLVLMGEGSATSGYVDFPLGVAYLGAAVYLLSYRRTRQVRHLALVGGMSVALVWTKAEGLILLGCLGVVLIVYLWREKGARPRAWVTPAALALLPGLCVYAAWQVFLKLNETVTSEAFLPVTASNLVAHIGRMSDVVAYWRHMGTDWATWGAFWPFLLGAGILVVVSACGLPRGLLALLVLPLVFYSTTFIFSAWADPTEHIATSLNRLALHIAPLGALTVALALNRLVRLGAPRPAPTPAHPSSEPGL